MKTIQEITHTDLIIVPAVHEEHSKALDMNKEAVEWLREQYNQGSEIAAYCIGVFLLARTGLLNGKPCSTHWGEAEALSEMFPEVHVLSEKIITESGGLYTSGGAYAFTNLIIYLIEKMGSRELAVLTAKAFMIDLDKKYQSVFSVFSGQKNHQDQLVLKVQKILEEQYQDMLSVKNLASHFAVNRRTLERRFRKATGNSVLEYLQRVRIESAKKKLENEIHNVSEAMYAVGYNDPGAFRELFKKYVGITPSDYKKKFSSE